MELKEIDLDKLHVGLSSVRIENVRDELDDLSHSIKTHGLIQPIIVFKKSDGQYEILAGQRRLHAFQKLNNENPEEGFDKITCSIMESTDEYNAKAIYVSESLTHLPMTMTDIIDACDVLFKKYNDITIVAKMTGISKILVQRYVKFARLPKLLQDNLDLIHKNPKSAVNLAVEATDTLCYTPNGDISEQKVFDLAKKFGDKKKQSQEDYKKLKQAAEEHHKESLEKIEEESVKIMNPKKYSIVLDAKTSNKLDSVAERNGNEPEDEAVELIEYGLERQEAPSAD